MISTILSMSLLLSLSVGIGEIGPSPQASGHPQSEPEVSAALDDLVVLEDLGPSSIAQPPIDLDLPEGFTVREKRYLLRNLSTEDILFYSISTVSERGGLCGGKSRYSYPPDDPPALAQGATEEIRFRGGNVDSCAPAIDFVMFADGSSYGPDKQRSRQRYIAAVEAKYVWAQHLLMILETQGPDALQELLLREIQNPNPAMRRPPKLGYWQNSQRSPF